MAAASFTPRVRLMAICDNVRESRTEPGVYHLKGVRHGIVAHAFPFVPRQLWLFLLLSSPRPGTFPGYVRVVDDRSDKAIFYAHLQPRPTFDAGDQMLPGLSRISCAFPDEGRYTVQVWFFQEQGSDVLKGEFPFFIAKEGA